MKFHFDQKYTQIAVYAVIVIVVSGFLLMSVSKFSNLDQFLELISSCAAPIVWGGVIAYLMNPGVEFFRLRVFRKWQEKAGAKRRVLLRNLSIVIMVLLALGLATALLFLIIPQLVHSVTGLVSRFDDYADSFMQWVYATFQDQPQIISAFENPLEQLEALINSSWADISETVLSFGSKIGGGVLNFVLGFKDFIIGFIIAIYLLSSKEMLKAQAKKLIFAVFRNSHAQNILYVSRKTNDIFIHYITGILIDAFFVGCATFIGASLIGTPYPLFLAVIIACTNIIPFFGPFIGGIPCCFLVLLTDPMKCLWFAVFLVVLQQFDGNIMVPLIQGDRTGVPSVWVLIGIIVGGGLFGFAGMLLAVPVFAVLYMLFREFLEMRLERKGLPAESALYGRDDLEKYVDGYEYTEDERKKDEKWLEGLSLKKRKPTLLRGADKREKDEKKKKDKDSKERKGQNP